MTFRHYKGGRALAKHTGRLYPRRNLWYSLSEAESTSGHMVLSRVPRKESPVTTPGIDSGTVRLVAQRLNHHATPGPQNNVISNIKLKNEFCLLILISGLNLLRRNWSRTSSALTNTSVRQSTPRCLSKFYIFLIYPKKNFWQEYLYRRKDVYWSQNSQFWGGLSHAL